MPKLIQATMNESRYLPTRLGWFDAHLEMLADLQAQVREESERQRAIPGYATVTERASA